MCFCPFKDTSSTSLTGKVLQSFVIPGVPRLRSQGLKPLTQFISNIRHQANHLPDPTAVPPQPSSPVSLSLDPHPPPQSRDNLIEAVAVAGGSLPLGCLPALRNQSFIRIRWIDSPEEKNVSEFKKY